MPTTKIKQELKKDYPDELVEAIVDNYVFLLVEFRKNSWLHFGVVAGQYIECCIRLVQHKVNGSYTGFGAKLPIFSEAILLQWENNTSNNANESFRIVIPRMLYSMYCIRNKRGMIHKNQIDPNKLDASVLLANAKWVLAEFVRLASNIAFKDAEALIDEIICRETDIIWDSGTILRVLDTSMNYSNQVVCLLYTRQVLTVNQLLDATEYSNSTRFKGLLMKMHKDRIIELRNSECMLTPKGCILAEQILSGK